MRSFRPDFSLSLVPLLLAFACTCTARADGGGGDVSMELIRNLAHADPEVRSDAQKALKRMGDAARPALVAASRGEAHPAPAAAAAHVLVEMPWYTRADPVTVRVALRDYAHADPAHRADVARRIGKDYPAAVGNRILLRLLREEPSEDVCWTILGILRGRLDDESAATIRSTQPAGRRASWLTLQGIVWFADDLDRAVARMREAVVVERHHPTSPGTELDIAFDAAAGAAILGGRPEEAAELRRIQSAQNRREIPGSTDPVFELFALHALYGPLRGLDEDRRTHCADLARPEVLYAIALTYERAGDWLAAEACVQAARGGSLTPERRLRVAGFLHRLGRKDWAVQELRAAVAAGGGDGDALIRRLNAHLWLARLADELVPASPTAVEHAEAALKLVESHKLALQRVGSDGRSAELDPLDLKRDLLWRRFRATRQSDAPEDRATADRHLEKLLQLKPRQSEVVLDVIEYLRTNGRAAEADGLFEQTYLTMKARLKAAPDDPQLMNELAWLCARAGRNLDEAVTLSTRAIAISPGVAAYLDTAAEAQFRTGNLEAAVRLERAAVTLEPHNAFMREQLERFQRAR